MTTYLYIGTRKGLDKWMYDHDINPSEHGKSVKHAVNGPNHLRLTDAPIKIVDEDEWYEKTIWDTEAIHTARLLNDIEIKQRTEIVKT